VIQIKMQHQMSPVTSNKTEVKCDAQSAYTRVKIDSWIVLPVPSCVLSASVHQDAAASNQQTCTCFQSDPTSSTPTQH